MILKRQCIFVVDSNKNYLDLYMHRYINCKLHNVGVDCFILIITQFEMYYIIYNVFPCFYGPNKVIII